MLDVIYTVYQFLIDCPFLQQNVAKDEDGNVLISTNWGKKRAFPYIIIWSSSDIREHTLQSGQTITVSIFGKGPSTLDIYTISKHVASLLHKKTISDTTKGDVDAVRFFLSSFREIDEEKNIVRIDVEFNVKYWNQFLT